MPSNVAQETDTTDRPVSLWPWFWALAFGVVALTLIAITAIAHKVAREQVVPDSAWPQCCDYWKAQQLSASKHLIY